MKHFYYEIYALLCSHNLGVNSKTDFKKARKKALQSDISFCEAWPVLEIDGDSYDD